MAVASNICVLSKMKLLSNKHPQTSKQETKQGLRQAKLIKLQDTEIAVNYLTDVLTHGDSQAFYIALQDVIEARKPKLVDIS